MDALDDGSDWKTWQLMQYKLLFDELTRLSHLFFSASMSIWNWKYNPHKFIVVDNTFEQIFREIGYAFRTLRIKKQLGVVFPSRTQIIHYLHSEISETF